MSSPDSARRTGRQGTAQQVCAARNKTTGIQTLRRSEAPAVDDAGAGLVVLLLGDPHLLEGGQGGQDGAADPDRLLELRGGPRS